MSDTSSAGPITSHLLTEDPSLVDLVEEFVAGLDNRTRAMAEAVDSNGFDALKSLAHQLKGAGGGYGYPSLSQASADLEQCALALDIQQCRRSFDELRALVARVEVGAS